MQRSGCFYTLFPVVKNLFEQNDKASDKPTVTIILDPDTLFVNNYRDYGEHKKDIFPLLQIWLDTLLSQYGVSTNIKLYLLAKNNEEAGISINICHEQLFYSINSKFFKTTLSEPAKKYLQKLWGEKIPTANLELTKNILNFSDGAEPLRETVFVITGSEDLTEAYNLRAISTYKTNTFNQPFLAKPLKSLESRKREIYLDFDVTTFGYATHLELGQLFETCRADEYNIKHSVLFLQLHFLLGMNSPLRIVQSKTLDLLETLNQHPTHLITQRSYISELETRYAEYLKAGNTINYINGLYELHIQCNQNSFLNAREQGEDFPPKIKKIHQWLKNRNPDTLPEEILLIDDGFEEISLCNLEAENFAKLGHHGVEINTALFLSSADVKPKTIEEIKKWNLGIALEVEKAFNIEIFNLNQSFNHVLEAAKKSQTSLIAACIEPITETVQSWIKPYFAGASS